MASTRLYPGMCDASLEIFFNEKENELMIIKGGSVMNYDSLPDSETQFLDEIIKNETDVRMILESWSLSNKDQKKMLAKCRFGGLNFSPDYKNGECQPDGIDCPLANECIGFGKVCKPINYNGNRLSNFDIKTIQLLISSMKNTVIAEELEIPLGSFETYRTKLYKNLNVNTKQELARVAIELGLV
ncbi:helix-turn-helix transcriptional regulator [Chryseobacterium oncorhynchi]|uniref:LuxR family transcriptional regulator n=1 Tax=Chryseobacterium oncorhynchi TaxID=741074 RepID=A0A316X1J3_9FLAO|nr:response regulator transcription factor [Chryseobacterium oncorhynchi]PWN67631.1 LuxR family transcriptional regulator [Chryseobacterium oncorhynchi]